MGIKDLNPFLKSKIPKCIEECDLCFFKNKKIAIDTSIYFYKYLYGNKDYLSKFFQQIVRLKLNQITPIYIFDGKPPNEKKNEIEFRKQKKIDLITKIENLKLELLDLEGNSEDINSKETEEKNRENISLIKKEIKKKTSSLVTITKQDIINLKQLLDTLNIKYIQADGEADNICNSLYRNKIVDMVLSEDMDLLVGGSDLLVRSFSINSNKVIIYDLDKIKEHLKFTDTQWVDFCILCGCDYVKRLTGIGPNIAYKLIQKYNNIEAILENNSKYKVYDNYILNVNKARVLFNNKDYNEEYSTIKFDFNRTDLFEKELENIKTYLLKKTRFNMNEIETKLNIVYN